MKQALEALEQINQLSVGENAIALPGEIDGAMDNLRAAIEQGEKQVTHSVVAGVLFDFMGWLTSREKRLTLSSTDEAGPAVEAITEFAKMRDLRLEDAQVEHWPAILTTPPAAPRKWVELTDDEARALVNRATFGDRTNWQAFVYMIDAKLKEKNG
jgi:hypothetical protein